jgi:hypothetical protein
MNITLRQYLDRYLKRKTCPLFYLKYGTDHTTTIKRQSTYTLLCYLPVENREATYAEK